LRPYSIRFGHTETVLCTPNQVGIEDTEIPVSLKNKVCTWIQGISSIADEYLTPN